MEEIADFIWWSAIVLLGSSGLSLILYETAASNLTLAGLVLCVYPTIHLGAEIAKWNMEQWHIVDFPDRPARIYKTWGITQNQIDNSLSSMGRTQIFSVVGRIFGFVNAHLVFEARTYLDGERVPIRLMEEIDRRVGKKDEPQPGSERELVISKLIDMVSTGIVDKGLARAFVSAVIGDNM